MNGYIPFKGHMARKVLAGAKTQTRRVITAEWSRGLDLGDLEQEIWALDQARYQAGQMLWIREPMTIVDARYTVTKIDDGEVVPVTLVRARYESDQLVTTWCDYPRRLADPKPGRAVAYGCPREFARGAVLITSVRVERVQSITRDDAIAEGIDAVYTRPGSAPCWKHYMRGDGYCTSPIDSFRTLWDSINAARGYGWDVNPHVFVYQFRLVSKGA